MPSSRERRPPRQKLVILRSSSLEMATRDVFRGPRPFGTGIPVPAAEAATAAAAEMAASVTVEVDEVPRDQVSALTRDATVLAVAPAMPVRLVHPVQLNGAVGAPPAAVAAGPTWGVRAVGADRSTFSGSGVVVAVLDTGINRAHAAFAGVNIVERDFVADPPGDGNGHGTHCAGTIFGRDVAGTRIGIARGVRTALIGKVLDSGGGGSTEGIVQGLLWAMDEGAHVISMSLGIDFPGYVDGLVARGLPLPAATSLGLEGYRQTVALFERLAALLQARSAMSQAVVLAAAAGNESDRPSFEIAVSPPAVAPGFLSVAALDQDGAGRFTVADFSNTGANVAAPGVGILSADARSAAGLRSLSGTSMATPHVAGVAALWAEKIMAAGPMSSAVLTARLIASATRAGMAPGVDPLDVGEGIVQAP